LSITQKVNIIVWNKTEATLALVMCQRSKYVDFKGLNSSQLQLCVFSNLQLKFHGTLTLQLC